MTWRKKVRLPRRFVVVLISVTIISSFVTNFLPPVGQDQNRDQEEVIDIPLRETNTLNGPSNYFHSFQPKKNNIDNSNSTWPSENFQISITDKPESKNTRKTKKGGRSTEEYRPTGNFLYRN